MPRLPVKYPALRAFLDHTDTTYHSSIPFDEVHTLLLAWYRRNRRRLPWRGDPPPYNGSTAGCNRQLSESIIQEAYTGKVPEASAVSAYGVWVSEIMCQQTRVEAVIPYWLAWMEVFPTVHALAAATEDEVNASLHCNYTERKKGLVRDRWAGLGFYRRARMLHEAAKQVVTEFNGELPRTVEGLMQMKGVGRYTAGAISSIYHGVAAPIVDGNVLRVFSRLCCIASSVQEPAFCSDGKLAWVLAEKLVQANDADSPGELNQAVMELGATLCAPGGTGVDGRDPLRSLYLSAQVGRDAHRAHVNGELEHLLDCDGLGVHSCPVCKAGAVQILAGLRAIGALEGKDDSCTASYVHQLLPLPKKKKPRRQERHVVAAVRTNESGGAPVNWLLVKRPEDGLLAGQWEFPHAIVCAHKDTLPDDPGMETRSLAARQLIEAAGVVVPDEALKQIPEAIDHIFSHIRHAMHIEHAFVEETAGREIREDGGWVRGARTYCWMDATRMRQVGVTAGVKKVLAAVAGCPNGAKQQGTKRKKEASEAEVKQPRISAFFSKP